MDAFEAERRDWLDPHYVDTETGRLLMSLHTYIIKTERHTVLIDTRRRPQAPSRYPGMAHERRTLSR